MKKLYILIYFLIIQLSFGQVINEFEPNPVGTDPTNVSFELKGTPNDSFSGWILSVESDSSSSFGLVDRATSVSGTFDSNGLLVVSIPDLENPSFTVILTSDFTGTVDVTDIDTNDDGTANETSTLGTIYDAIGIPDDTGDEATLYGADLGGADFVYTGDEPGLVFRDETTGDWYAVNDPAGTDVYDISANAISASSFDNDPTTGATFGTANPVFTGTASVKDNDIPGFSAYPNPVINGVLRVKTFLNDTKEVQIFDVLGKKVFSRTTNRQELNVSKLNSGVYILRVSENGKTATRKLVIK